MSSDEAAPSGDGTAGEPVFTLWFNHWLNTQKVQQAPPGLAADSIKS